MIKVICPIKDCYNHSKDSHCGRSVVLALNGNGQCIEAKTVIENRQSPPEHAPDKIGGEDEPTEGQAWGYK